MSNFFSTLRYLGKHKYKIAAWLSLAGLGVFFWLFPGPMLWAAIAAILFAGAVNGEELLEAPLWRQDEYLSDQWRGATPKGKNGKKVPGEEMRLHPYDVAMMTKAERSEAMEKGWITTPEKVEEEDIGWEVEYE